MGSEVAYLLWRQTQAPVDWRRGIYAALAVLALFAPWWPTFVARTFEGQARPIHRTDPVTLPLLADTLSVIGAGQPVFGTLNELNWTIQPPGTPGVAAVGAVTVAGLVLVGIRARQDSPDAGSLLLCAALLPPALAAVASLGVRVFAPRYLLFIGPPLALLVGSGLASVATKGTPWGRLTSWKRLATSGLAVAVVLPNVLGPIAFYRQPRLDIFDWRRIGQTLAEGARVDDAILFLPGSARIHVDYYFRGPQRRLSWSPTEAEAAGGGAARIAETVDTLTQGSRVWIVMIPRHPAVGRCASQRAQPKVLSGDLAGGDQCRPPDPAGTGPPAVGRLTVA